MEYNDVYILHNQYYGGWWSGDAACHGISNYGIGQVTPEYFGFSTTRAENDDVHIAFMLIIKEPHVAPAERYVYEKKEV